MADNVDITPGAGVTIGADEVSDPTLGTITIQYVKVMDGVIDSTNKMAVNSLGAVLVTGSTAVIGTVTVTGSTSVVNTVTVTGSTAIIGTVTVTGSTSVISMPTTTITGSTTVINTVAVTGSTSVINTVTVTGSTSVINTVGITGSTSVIASVHPVGMGTVGSDRTVCPTAGTATQLANHACKLVILTAETDNAGTIFVGDSSVAAAPGSEQGFVLFASQTSVPLPISNTNLLYINSTENGDGVAYAFFT